MRYLFFTINAIDPEQDAQALNTCLSTQRIISIDRQFVPDGQNSYWSCCVGIADGAFLDAKSKKRQRVDYREELSPQIFAVFAKLRKARNELADEQAIPAYAIFTNSQLAEIAQLEAPSRESIAAIEGVGEKRMSLYADIFLAILAESDA